MLRFEGWVCCGMLWLSLIGLGFAEFSWRNLYRSRIFVDGNMVVSNDGVHAALEQCNACYLQPGMHIVRVDGFQGSGDNKLYVEYM